MDRRSQQDAIRYAHERADRERVPMVVWYTRSDNPLEDQVFRVLPATDPKPFGGASIQIYRADPEPGR